MTKTREEIESNLLSVTPSHERFMDFCEDRGGQMDQRLEVVACGFGSGDLHYDEEDDVTGDLVVVNQRGRTDASVNFFIDGEQIRDGSLYLEDIQIDEEGDLRGELGPLSGF